MKKSIRARRMERHHKRQQNKSKLNLVSLMDIFTILVFFLLVNSSDVEVLQTNKSIKLPDSHSEQRPDTTLVVTVNEESIVVSGRAVANVSQVLSGDSNSIEGLESELKYQAKKAGPLEPEKEQQGRAVTIMGDKGVPYEILKKIMTTCAANEYRNISLAVNKVARADIEGGAPADADAGGQATGS